MGDDEVAHVAVVQEVGVKLVDRLAQGQRGLFGVRWSVCW